MQGSLAGDGGQRGLDHIRAKAAPIQPRRGRHQIAQTTLAQQFDIVLRRRVGDDDFAVESVRQFLRM